MVSVTDTGSGIPPDVLAKVFEPFFTTKPVGKGSGLGLSQVLGFAKQSDGGVAIDSRPDEGTAVKVYLPRAQVEAVGPRPTGPAELAPAAAAVDGRAPHLLVVDDDGAVREVTSSILRRLGYAVTEAGSGDKALDLLARGGEFDLLLIDFAMPDMNGGELARRVHAQDPGRKIVFITGYADFGAIGARGEGWVVQKPFRDGELARQVAAALAYDKTAARPPRRVQASRSSE
jgi:CheY-like chemotaxis protein